MTNHRTESGTRSILRRARAVFAPRLQGQDVERPDNVPGRRSGSNFAAMHAGHSTQGITPIGFQR